MDEFETILICFLVPLFAALFYVSGKGDLLNVTVMMLQEKTKEIEESLNKDVVEVVRCEDCKYRVLDTVAGEDWCNHTLGLCSEVYATDFCCHGERKDNG